jgi:hypothetical protein
MLTQMLTLRIHLDKVTNENGPLRAHPGSHVSPTSEGDGLDATIDVHAKTDDMLAMRRLISHSIATSVEGTHRHHRILHLEFVAMSTLPDGVTWHDLVIPPSASVTAG